MLLPVSFNRAFTSSSKSSPSDFPKKEREANKWAEGKEGRNEGFVLLRVPSDFRTDFQIGTHLSPCSLSGSSKRCQAPDVWSGKLFGDSNLFDVDLLLIGLLLFFFFFIFKTFRPLSKSSSSTEKLSCKRGSECHGGGRGQEKTLHLCPWFPKALALWGQRVGSSFSVCLLTHVLSCKEEVLRERLVSEHGLLSHGFHNLKPIEFAYFFTNILTC